MLFLMKAFAFLGVVSSATAAYNIQNCNPTQKRNLRNALDDAALLASRAASTLQQAITDPAGIPPPVKLILDAFLTHNANGAAYQSVLAAYNSIANHLQNKDIQYSCIDLNIQIPHLQGFYHPLDLQRIGGQVNPSHHPECAWYFYNNHFVSSVTQTNQNAQAVTLTFAPRMSNNYQAQIRCTGSDHIWSDITLVRSLQGGNPITLAQWPSFLGRQSWRDLVGFEDEDGANARSFQRNDVLSETMLHELMHSIAIPNPTNQHSEGGLSGGPANSLTDVLDAAAEGQVGVLPLFRNPGTLSWLCVSLAMPWYKLFDEQTESWDGVVRYNLYGNNQVWLPNWVTHGAQPTEEVFNRALEQGPYF